MNKRERQRLVEAFIAERLLSTQGELVAALKESGLDVTQATVSRDIREMGVQKGTDREGRVRYIMPPPQERRDPEASLARSLRDTGSSVVQAQNLVLVRSDPGTAPSVGRLVDELGHEDIIGTVAGDDTVLIVMGDVERADRIAAYLENLMEAG